MKESVCMTKITKVKHKILIGIFMSFISSYLLPINS